MYQLQPRPDDDRDDEPEGERVDTDDADDAEDVDAGVKAPVHIASEAEARAFLSWVLAGDRLSRWWDLLFPPPTASSAPTSHASQPLPPSSPPASLPFEALPPLPTLPPLIPPARATGPVASQAWAPGLGPCVERHPRVVTRPPTAQERYRLRRGGWTSPNEIGWLMVRAETRGYWLHTGDETCRCDWCVAGDSGAGSGHGQPAWA